MQGPSHKLSANNAFLIQGNQDASITRQDGSHTWVLDYTVDEADRGGAYNTTMDNDTGSHTEDYVYDYEAMEKG